MTAVRSAERPPAAPVRPVTESYHGTLVVDAYRYMENFDDPDVRSWVRDQADYAERKLRGIPGRQALLARIREIEAGTPFRVADVARTPNGDLFYLRQEASENVAKLYRRMAATGEERLLIDPETLPKSGPNEHNSLAFFKVSPAVTKILYGFAASGSEETVLRVRDLATGQDLPDSIDRLEIVYATPDWLPDDESFVYSRRRELPEGAAADEGYEFTQAFVHVLGTDVEDDPIVFAQGAPGSPTMTEMDFPAVIVTPGSDWVVGQIKHGDDPDLTLYTASLTSLAKPTPNWTLVCRREDQVADYAVHGDRIDLVTASGAPRSKLVRTSLSAPDFSSATVVVPPGSYVVRSVAAASDAAYVGILESATHSIVRAPYADGAPLARLTMPNEEPSGVVSAARADVPGVFVETSSWTRASRSYVFDPVVGELVDARLAPRGSYDDLDWLTSTEALVPSHDGTPVPLSIVHRKDVVLDGSAPTLLSGYGAYGFTNAMNFSPSSAAWLERGGVLAVAHVRGGGAFGKEWHLAGRMATKPNTWKDFIACAEFLIDRKYCSPAKLAGKGGSAGGILIGRAITERPDLFAAAQIAVGCTDMLRFETTLNGPPNVAEFGSTQDPIQCAALLEMSALHHVRDGVAYPAVILTHGINDHRVEPWQSAKATARFQAATASGRPILFRVDYQAGHGIGSTKSQRQEELADVWSFLLWQMNEPGFQPSE